MSNSSNINGEESTVDFLKTAATKRESIRETLERLHSQTNSLLQLSVQWKDLEEYFEAKSDAMAKREKEIEVKLKEIDWKQKYLNRKASDIESKEERVKKSLNDRRKAVDEEYKEVSKLYREAREKEKYIDDELKILRLKNERLREDKRDLKRKFEKEQLKLETKELMLDNREEELDVRRMKLNSHERSLLERIQDIESREKRLEEKVREYEKSGKVFELKDFVGVKAKDKHVDLDNDDEDSDEGLNDPTYADLKLNVIMNGRALQMFLNGRMNDHEVLRDEVITGLGMSADPAKLVLDAMQGFYPEELGDDVRVGFDSNVVRKSCILLLEQLTKMKPRIKARIKERAMRIAVEWIGKMKVDDGGDHFLEIVGFLLLVAAYGLSFGFAKDELASLFERCVTYGGAPELCSNLGLKEDVNDIIQNLILRHQPFEALRLIYTFELVNVFPPVPILKSHLMFSFQLAEEVNNNGDPSLNLQIECIKKKLSALVSVVKCIQEHGLEPKYPIQPLEQLISELEMQEKSLVSALQVKSNRENKDPNMTHYPSSTSVKETDTSMIAFNSSDESLVAYDGRNSMLTDIRSSQTQRNTGNKRRLASVVAANDADRLQSMSREWDVNGRAPVYYCLDRSWGCYGNYNTSSYYCFH